MVTYHPAHQAVICSLVIFELCHQLCSLCSQLSLYRKVCSLTSAMTALRSSWFVRSLSVLLCCIGSPAHVQFPTPTVLGHTFTKVWTMLCPYARLQLPCAMPSGSVANMITTSRSVSPSRCLLNVLSNSITGIFSSSSFCLSRAALSRLFAHPQISHQPLWEQCVSSSSISPLAVGSLGFASCFGVVLSGWSEFVSCSSVSKSRFLTCFLAAGPKARPSRSFLLTACQYSS